MTLKRSLLFIFKLLIIVVSYTYLIWHLINAPDIQQLPILLTSLSLYQILALVLVLVLMWVNWSVEAYKWKLLNQGLEQLSYLKSIKSVFAGVSAGIATPNRLGEFTGRMLFASSGNRMQAGVLAIAGSFSQLAVSLGMGLVGFLVIVSNLPEGRGLFAVPDYIIIVFGILLLALVILGYAYIHIISLRLSKFKIFRKFKELQTISDLWTPSKKWKVLLLSIIRYAIFIHQFYIIIWVFQIDVDYLYILAVVSCVYFVMALIPVISIWEPGVRASVSIILFGIFTFQPAAVVTASLLLWIINVAVPALLGTFCIIETKTEKK